MGIAGERNDVMDRKGKLTFYAMGGVYLLYMSYKLFMTVQENGVEKAMAAMVFSVLFLVGGISLLFITYRIYRNVKNEDEAAMLAAMEAAEKEKQKDEAAAGELEETEGVDLEPDGNTSKAKDEAK